MIRLVAFTATSALLLTTGLTATADAEPTHAQRHSSAVWVAGAVATPVTYTPAEVAALAQVTLPDRRNPDRTGREVTGASLQSLVAASAPILPAVKNAQLRVTLTVTGRHHAAVALTLGELDPNGGNHPALLVSTTNRPQARPSVDLVVPGDLGYRRTVRDVSRIQVAIAAPELPTDLPPGAIRVTAGKRVVTLTAARLSQLPAVTRTVAFRSGQGPQTHVETGPTLASVLRAAKVKTTPTTTVAAIAGDSYVATVTPAEATSGRRPLLLSLIEDGAPLEQPRLVTDGDVFGGRYVSGVLALDVVSARHHR